MPQVIIVSNRLPISVKKEDGQLVFSPSLGGLATGLSSYVNNRSGNMWIGWPGIASEQLTTADKQTITSELSKQSYIPVFLSQRQIEHFYDGYCNSYLWPLFHGLPMKAVNQDLLLKWWQSYQLVNRRFSEVILSFVDNKSHIWVHDYQLLLLPELLRKEQVEGGLGFFLHIPFPSPRRLSRVTEYEKLLSGMAGADLVGFHTSSYAQNFIKSAKQAGLGEVYDSQIMIKGRLVRVSDFPMGIDYVKFAKANKLKNVQLLAKNYKKKYRRQKIIASVDRLDPSKGLLERLKAYQNFLELNPKWLGKVVFVMVAAPSRTTIAEYQNLARNLDKLSKEINETYGNAGWQPVDYNNVSLPFESVTALFQIADVAFIAPLRDGMNLTAKEFVASNNRGGVLILSATAGAAEELSDAIIVDPKNQAALVEALNQALSMRRLELRRRLNRMRKHLSNNTVQDWAKTFVDTLQQPLPGTPHITRTLGFRLQKKLLNEYKSSNKRLLLLDYDGTLAAFTEDYAKASPTEAILKLLKNLAADKTNDVVLISGRTSAELDKWFKAVAINFVAEHGAAIKKVGKPWQVIEKSDSNWKKLLLPSLEKYVALTPGAKIEVKPHSLVWHYRAASAYQAQKYTVIIKRALRPVLKQHGLQMLQGNKIVEIKNPKISKGAAATRWLDGSHDFVLSMGDDVTDEDVFAVMPLYAYSIKIGRGLTKAKYRLYSTSEAIRLLRKMV